MGVIIGSRVRNLKKGDCVFIYADPCSCLQLEGRATLIKKVKEDDEFEYWNVKFSEDENPVLRKFMKEEK